MIQLLTTEDVAEALGCAVRKVKYLPIPIVRVGRHRRYDPKDVTKYIEACKCLSTSAPTRPIGGRKSPSQGTGLDEALALHPAETPKPSSASSETILPPRHVIGRKARPSSSLRLIRQRGGIGSNTAGAAARSVEPAR